MTSALLADDPNRIGDYELTARLGQGGQGVVYLGTDPGGAQVALKVLNRDVAADRKFRARFAREVEAARKVAAFCTAAVLDADVTAETPYIVSEYIPGPSLKESVQTDGPRRGAALDRLAIATATALVAIHQAGVVHRDFKPANVVLSPEGPRVIDFGIARAPDSTMTQTNSLIGTPAYMAPEQVQGRDLGPPVDIFAWACVIAYAATGASPFHGETLPTVMHRVLSESPDLGQVPDPLRSILESCLNKDPSARPTATRLLSTLLGQDPEATSALPVNQVLATGYTVATQEFTAAAPTPEPDAPATAPVESAAGSGPAATRLMPAADGEKTATPETADTASSQQSRAGLPAAPGPPGPSAPPAEGEEGRPAPSKNPMLPWLVSATLALLLVGGFAGWWWAVGASGSPEAEPAFEEEATTEPVEESPAPQEDQPVLPEPEPEAPEPFVPQEEPQYDTPAPVDPETQDPGQWEQETEENGAGEEPGGGEAAEPGGDPPPPPPGNGEE